MAAIFLAAALMLPRAQNVALSQPFPIANQPPNSLPQVRMVEPVANPDGEGSLAMRFLLFDEEEESADIVIQWLADKASFPDVSDLADAAFRRRVLLDPDERAPRRILTPRLRTIVEGRARVANGQPADEVVLTWMLPPTGITARTFVGAALDLLSDAGALEQTRLISEVDPARRVLRVERAFDPPPRQGQRVQARETIPKLLTVLPSSRIGEGLEHGLAWDAPLDVGTGGAGFFFRVTAFWGSQLGSTFTTTVAKGITATRLGFVQPEPPVLMMTEGNPVWVTATDLNGDDLVDLVSADHDPSQLSLFLGLGNGTFRRPEPPVLPTGEDPLSIAAADIDGDGHVDLVSADEDPSQLSLFLGLGDGTFERAEPQALPIEGRPLSVVATDLDGDGRVDLVSAVSSVDQLSIFLGLGDGKFRRPEPPSVPTEGPQRSLLAADLDDDGHVDLVSVSWNHLSVLLGLGNGTFRRPEPAAAVLPTGENPACVIAADLNHDDRVDLISAADRQLSVFLGLGDGTFRRPEPPIVPAPSHPQSVVSADLNADGHLDLVSAHVSSQLSLFLGLGDGTFRIPEPPDLLTGRWPRSLAAADLDGDGRLDLVSADSFSHHLSLFLGREDSEFGRPEPVAIPPEDRPGLVVVAADLDGNGHLDLVAQDGSLNRLSLFLGQGDGAFRRPEPPTLPSLMPHSGVAADLDGDGNLDLVWGDLERLPAPAVDPTRPQLSLFLGQGDGTFRRPESSLPTASALGFVAADLDGDGHLDLVSPGPFDGGSDRLLLFFGRGDGTFRDPSFVETGEAVVSVIAPDLNADGHLDLVSVVSWSDQLSVRLGVGDGSFWPESPRLSTGELALSVVAADLDADGKLDLVSQAGPNALNQGSLFLGQGDGTFRPPILLEGSSRPNVAMDLNGDGHVDLLAGPSLLLGQSDGTFGPPMVLEGNPVTAADLNGDGQLDLVSANDSRYQLALLLNGAQGPLPPSFFGMPRTLSPTPGNALGGDLVLAARQRSYRINTSSGTVDGVRSPGYQGQSFHFARVHIEAGAKVIAWGEFPLALLSQGEVTIEGELIASGASAEDAGSMPGQNRGSAGGEGGPGAARGGAGGGVDPGTRTVHGLRGGGSGGGQGGRLPSSGVASGAGGGYGSPGGPGAGGEPAPRGGAPYGNSGIEILFGGSGGGGGSIADQNGSGTLNPGDASGNGGDDGGGGGGGGGGTVRITAGGTITIAGKVAADGGDGGRGNAGIGGHGGGGSGGSILLQSYGRIILSPWAVISAAGGKGAVGGSSPSGGDGGDGRIRFEDADGVLESGGTIVPDSQASNVAVLPPLGPPPVASPRFRRGDANADGTPNLTDAIFTLNHLFAGGDTPPCLKSEDSDDSGFVGITDAVLLLVHLFQGGPAPAEPFTACAADPTPDDLLCLSYMPCP